MWYALASFAIAQPVQEPHVELMRIDALSFPQTLTVSDSYWATNRLGQLFLRGSEASFLVDVQGRTLRPTDLDSERYTFPNRYLTRWSDDWQVVEDGVRTPLADGPDFTAAALLPGWGEREHDVLARIGRDGIDLYAVSPPSTQRVFPTCVASVPESCLGAGLQTLRQNAGHVDSTRVARAQLGRACASGVTRACLLDIHVENGADAKMAGDCLDGEGAACYLIGASRLRNAKEAEKPLKLPLVLLEHACSLGETNACQTVAAVMDEGDDPQRALVFLDRACSSGDRTACVNADERRFATLVEGLDRSCRAEPTDEVACITLAQELEAHPLPPYDPFDSWSRACATGAPAACRATQPYVDRWGVDAPRIAALTDSLSNQCTSEGGGACLAAGHLLVRLPKNSSGYINGRQFLSRACMDGLNDACLLGAETRWEGDARRLDLPSSNDLYGTACDRGSTRGCRGLAHALRDSDVNGAIAAATKGCAEGDPHSCSLQVVWTEQQSKSTTPDSLPILSAGCEDDDAFSCVEWADRSTGEDRASRYAKACDLGDARACEESGTHLLNEQTPFATARAVDRLTVACEKERSSACTRLAPLVMKGKGTTRDPKRARELKARARGLQRKRHLRFGLRAGALGIVGLEAEAVLPVSLGPALSVGADASVFPGFLTVSPVVRLYPANAARGLYGAVGAHWMRIRYEGDVTTHAGFNGRIGIRIQRGPWYAGLEVGLGTLSAPNLKERIAPVPLLVPLLGLSGGLAF